MIFLPQPQGKLVIGGAVGGIQAQLIRGVNRFLVHSSEEAASRPRFLLPHPRAAEQMGVKGRKYVRRTFLIARQVRNYLSLMLTSLHQKGASTPPEGALGRSGW